MKQQKPLGWRHFPLALCLMTPYFSRINLIRSKQQPHEESTTGVSSSGSLLPPYGWRWIQLESPKKDQKRMRVEKENIRSFIRLRQCNVFIIIIIIIVVVVVVIVIEKRDALRVASYHPITNPAQLGSNSEPVCLPSLFPFLRFSTLSLFSTLYPIV